MTLIFQHFHFYQIVFKTYHCGKKHKNSEPKQKTILKFIILKIKWFIVLVEGLANVLSQRFRNQSDADMIHLGEYANTKQRLHESHMQLSKKFVVCARSNKNPLKYLKQLYCTIIYMLLENIPASSI